LPKVEGGSDTVLYPASVRAGSDLQDALTQSGFAVTRIHTYNTVRAGAWPRLPGARRHPRLPALPLPAGAGGGGVPASSVTPPPPRPHPTLTAWPAGAVAGCAGGRDGGGARSAAPSHGRRYHHFWLAVCSQVSRPARLLGAATLHTCLLAAPAASGCSRWAPPSSGHRTRCGGITCGQAGGPAGTSGMPARLQGPGSPGGPAGCNVHKLTT